MILTMWESFACGVVAGVCLTMIILGVLLLGGRSRKEYAVGYSQKCPNCPSLLIESSVTSAAHDAYYCPACDEWVDPPCADERCPLCTHPFRVELRDHPKS